MSTAICMHIDIEAIKKKDKNAIGILYNNYGKKLYGYAVLKWKVEEDAAWDLVYQTLYKVLNVIDRYTFESEQKFTGFIFTAFTNNLRNHYQKHKHGKHATIRLHEAPDKGFEDTQTEPETKSSAHMKCLQAGLAEMEDWKRVLLLMRAQEHSYEDIAAYIQKPADQLKVYYMRLKKIITEKVNECLSKIRQ